MDLRVTDTAADGVHLISDQQTVMSTVHRGGRELAQKMAAAPDLLEALADLFERGEVHVALAGNPIACEQLEAKCRAAIAKARGEEA